MFMAILYIVIIIDEVSAELTKHFYENDLVCLILSTLGERVK